MIGKTQQLEVLRLYAEGKTVREISETVDVTLGSVNSTIRHGLRIRMSAKRRVKAERPAKAPSVGLINRLFDLAAAEAAIEQSQEQRHHSPRPANTVFDMVRHRGRDHIKQLWREWFRVPCGRPGVGL